MTISARRKSYWLFTAASLLFAVVLAVAAGRLVRFQGAAVSGMSAPSGPDWILACAGAGLSVFVSLLTLSYILASFRKTVSTEIFFFAFFMLSMSLETLRPLVFLASVTGRPDTIQVIATRILLGARYAGALALFMSSVHASGFRNEKYGAHVLILLVVAGGLAAIMPVNSGIPLPTLELKPGYVSLNAWFFAMLGGMAVAGFLGAWYLRGERIFLFVAAGCAASYIGARMLAISTDPVMLVIGFAVSCSGSWLFVSRLHEYYLWL